MPGDVAGWCSGLLFRRRCRGGRFTQRRGGGHLGDHLVKQNRASFRLLLAAFAMAIGMLSVASLANHFRNAAVNHAGDSVVQKKAAARAVIVDKIAESLFQGRHLGLFRTR